MTRTRGNSPGPEFNDPGPPGAWAKNGSCRGTPIQLVDYFGKKRVDWGASKVVCRGCPVRRECLSYALQLGAVEGVWGGLDPLELRFVLGRDATGELWTYTRQDVKCPMCRGRTEASSTSVSAVGFMLKAGRRG